jgi:hypothetical protein
MNETILNPDTMRERKAAFYRHVQSRSLTFFTADGEYSPQIEGDRRITYWILPALFSAADPKIKALGLNLYTNDPCWNEWNIFTTSSIASNLMRERTHLTPELIARSEEHLSRFAKVDGGRQPCSGANDYMFHGANDNMPAMATRTLVFAGELLGRKDLLDHGLFLLETLCANFQRRGLLSEYNSSTYTPITLVSLMDIAECAKNTEAREMAEACANRVLLDLVSHWHQRMGAPSGSSSRCYLPDHTLTLSTQNTLMWYLGFPGVIDPIQALSGNYDGPLHHGPDNAFMTAQFVECFSPDFSRVRPGIVDFARQERSYPYEVRATMDSMKTTSVQTRTWQQPNWSLGTASVEMWAGQSGQHVTLRGTVLRDDDSSDWRNRVALWHYVQSGPLDWGDMIAPPHNYREAPTTHVADYGQYHVLQDKGSAMMIGNLGTALIGKEVDNLKFVIIASIFDRMADEMLINETPLTEWSGEANASEWHFLRFGDVFIGLRAAGMLDEVTLPLRRVLKDGYLRLEMLAFEGKATLITQELRKTLDYAYVLEMASSAECSFAQFRAECQKATWECFHAFYRNSRYQGRHGELQIVDSIDPEGVRFMAVDGETENPTFFSATGMDPKLLQLFPDGRRVRQRRILYDFDFVGSPFYKIRQHVLARDAWDGSEKIF